MAQQLEPEEAVLLESAREAALRYSDFLPDFICTEVVRRTQDPQGNGRWHSVDTLTIKLSYFGHKEDYKLMLVNGKPTALDYLHAGGALSTGEFGTRLLSLFEPRIRTRSSTGRVGRLFGNAAPPGFPIASPARIRFSGSNMAP